MKASHPTPSVGLPDASRGGFTLVEVLLTIVIMSGILVAITQVLNSARVTRDVIYNIQETQLAGPAIMDRIERDLRAIHSFNRDAALSLRVKDRVVAGIDADRLDFVATVNSLVPVEGRYRYLYADVNEVGYCLRLNPVQDDFLEIYRREDFGVDEEPFEGGRYTFLHERVKGFNIDVFAEDGEDAEALEDWGPDAGEEEFGLPARLEITLVLELSPRAQQMPGAFSIQSRTVEYRRVIRFSEAARTAQAERIVPLIPDIRPPAEEALGPGATGEDGEELPEGLEGQGADPGIFTGDGVTTATSSGGLGDLIGGDG